MRAIFIGGVLDGQEREIAGALDYKVPVPDVVKFTSDGLAICPTPTQIYRRSRTVYVDGTTHASLSNQGRLSHVEMRLLEKK